MASHPKATNRFQSVVIAIHGWNGACASTFGEGRRNMLNLINVEGSFDVDCFDYDSRAGTIEQARLCLQNRLENLKGAGFKEFALITHSAGGIIALDLVLTEGLDGLPQQAAQRLIFDPDAGLKLRGLYAWAVPINGVRSTIQGVGTALRFWKWLNSTHEAILPDLSPGSDYLKGLYQRLGRYDQRMKDDTVGGRFQFSLNFLQGNDDDFVVRSISPEDGWWPSNLQTDLIDTEKAHSINVGDAGTVGVPGFPAVVQGQALDLVFGLFPRFEPYFGTDATPSEFMENQRKAIVDGIANYVSKPSLFRTGRNALTGLIGKVFTSRYQRSPANDEYISQRISRLLTTWFEGQDKVTALEVASLMIWDLERQLANIQDSQPTTFGGGSRRALRSLVCDLQSTFVQIAGRNGLVRQANLSAAGEAHLRAFEKRFLTLFGNLLERLSTDPQSFDCAQTLIQEAAVSADPKAIIEARLIEKVGAYIAGQKNFLTADAKRRFGQTYIDLAKREDLTDITLGSLSAKTEWLGQKNTPLWTTFFTDEQITEFSAALIPRAPEKLERLEFVTDVLQRVGSTGTNPQISIMIGREVFKSFQPVSPIEKFNAYDRVMDAARSAPYPRIERGLRQELGAGLP